MERGNCIVCGKLTRYAFRYDIDCSPIWTHKKCEGEAKVQMLFFMFRNKKDGEEYKNKLRNFVDKF